MLIERDIKSSHVLRVEINLTGGGGGGVLPYMYAYWVCAARETPIFSPEFLFRSISF